MKKIVTQQPYRYIAAKSGDCDTDFHFNYAKLLTYHVTIMLQFLKLDVSSVLHVLTAIRRNDTCTFVQVVYTLTTYTNQTSRKLSLKIRRN